MFSKEFLYRVVESCHCVIKGYFFLKWMHLQITNIEFLHVSYGYNHMPNELGDVLFHFQIYKTLEKKTKNVFENGWWERTKSFLLFPLGFPH